MTHATSLLDPVAGTFEVAGVTHHLPPGSRVEPRGPGRRARTVARYSESELGGPVVHFADGGRVSRLASFFYDYDLSPFAVANPDPLPVPRPERPRGEEVVEAVAEVVVPPAPTAAIEKVARGTVARAEIAGLVLEVVTEEGDAAPKWVTLRSTFGPFGKEVKKQLERLQAWADLRKFQVGPESRAGNLPDPEVWCIRWDQVVFAIAEMPVKGVPEAALEGLVRFKRESAPALHAYFVEGVAVNPRAQASAPTVAPSADVLALLHGQQAIMAQLAAGKADRIDVDRKADRSEVEAIARKAAEDAIAKRTGAAPRESEVPAGGMGVRELLVDAQLPTETIPGKRHHYTFACIVFFAIDRHVDAKVPYAPAAKLAEIRRTLKKATAEYHRLGWSTDAQGRAIAGRCQEKTVKKRLIEAMRKKDFGPLSLVPGGGGGDQGDGTGTNGAGGGVS